MYKEDLSLIKDTYKQEKERINKLDWLDLHPKELGLIDDIEKRKHYYKQMRGYHIHVINPLANSVSKNFKFSVGDSELTYRIMTMDFLKYFKSLGMDIDEIMEMMKKNRTIVGKKGRKK